jgi:CRP/FNR family cyclic AMP-dependent transcriptional regulator
VAPLTSGSTFDPDVLSAITASNLRKLPSAIVSQVAAGAHRVTIPAGSTIHGEGEAAPHVEVVVRGLIRVYVTAFDGRTLTIRYCRSGALIGVATMYAAGSSRPFAVQALVDSDLLRLRPDVVRNVADREPRLAAALLAETSERVMSFVAELSDTAFATVRRRVARHLLDLASEQQRGAELVANISQQELADAVGTVREVVVPVLRELREAGVVRTGRNGTVILKPDRLLSLDDSNVE